MDILLLSQGREFFPLPCLPYGPDLPGPFPLGSLTAELLLSHGQLKRGSAFHCWLQPLHLQRAWDHRGVSSSRGTSTTPPSSCSRQGASHMHQPSIAAQRAQLQGEAQASPHLRPSSQGHCEGEGCVHLADGSWPLNLRLIAKG